MTLAAFSVLAWTTYLAGNMIFSIGSVLEVIRANKETVEHWRGKET